jgi:hypothetical protein
VAVTDRFVQPVGGRHVFVYGGVPAAHGQPGTVKNVRAITIL